MADKDYNILREVNDHYFTKFVSFSLLFTLPYEPLSEEAKLASDINQLVEQKNYPAAIELAEKCISLYPNPENTFLELQIYAYWTSGNIPNQEFLAYYTGMEEVLPKAAYINFNKAYLYIREKNFNAAVEELKKARAKEPNHKSSTGLLFLIYYFAKDELWRSLYLNIQKSKIFEEKITNIISIGDTIRNNSFSPVYKSADKDRLKSSNDELLAKFPEFVMVKPPEQENILIAAAETNYLRDYIVTLIMSALELPERNFGIHVHLYNPMGIDIDLLKLYDRKYPEARLSYSYEKGSLTYEIENTAYYASMRFARAYQILEQSNVKKAALLDADSLIKQDPFSRDDIRNADVVLTKGPDMAPYWENFAGGFNCFSKTETGLKAAGYIANVILKNMAESNGFWFLDQVAIFDMFNHLSKTQKIDSISYDDLFGKDSRHVEGTTFWTYTNEDKIRDNPMNRERQNLIAKYAINQEWNLLIHAKYGRMCMNRNDEYITRNIMAYGSWCDHEIVYMRSILDIGDTVLEIGANMGSHTLALAKHVGNEGKVIAIEAQRLMFQSVCANIAMNSLQNVHAYNIAIGEQEGILKVSELDPQMNQNFGGYRPKENTGETEVALRTVDSLKIDKCKLIKMDIEGMELEALKGAKETLSRLQPVLFFESHGEEVKSIADFLKDFGYTIYDFALADDPMYLAVTEKYICYPEMFHIKPIK